MYKNFILPEIEFIRVGIKWPVRVLSISQVEFVNVLSPLLSHEELHVVRKPAQLNTENLYQVRLAEGQVDIHFSKVNQTETK